MYSPAEWAGKSFVVIDTGGVDLAPDNEIELQVKEQASLAITEAHAIVFVVDGQQGLTPQDKEVIENVRSSGKRLLLAVNKIDDPKHEVRVGEFYELGVKETFALSAEHGFGISDLLEQLVQSFPEIEPETPSPGIQVAIIGKPNAGKSSLTNRLLNSDRCIISNIPGTTRDSVDTELTFQDQAFALIDTAGIRRKGKTTQLLDKYSVIMALKALDRCDIAVLVIDAETGVTDQDATIAGYATERGRGCLIVVNKWDLMDSSVAGFKAFEQGVRNKLKFMDFAPIMPVSAKTGYGLGKFFPRILEVYSEYTRQIPTAKLNDCFMKAIQKNPMSSYRGKFLKLYYVTQVKTGPPMFQCFVNYPEGIHFSYQRYLVNFLRKSFGFSGIPLKLILSSRHSGG